MMLGLLIQYGIIFAASTQAAAVKPCKHAHAHPLAALYDGAAAPPRNQEYSPERLEKPTTHSEAVMAELKRLSDVHRHTRLHLHHHHINHSKEPTTPIDDAASHDEPLLTIAEPVTESHEQKQLPSDLLTEEEQEQTQTTSEESEKQDLKR
ncbi:hypothetical protein SMMN14_08124 [Sphaerulina musiva]